MPLGGTASCWGGEGRVGSSATAAAVVSQSREVREDLNVRSGAAAGLRRRCLGSLLRGVSAPGHPPRQRFLPEVGEYPAVLGSWSCCCSRPTCLLLCRGTIGSFIRRCPKGLCGK